MSHRVFRRSLVLALLVCGAARADGASTPLAETTFRNGVACMEAGKVHECCAMFEASYEALHAVATLRNLARCHELDGRLATAWAEYKEASAKAERAGQGDRAADSEARARELEPKLHKVRIDAAGLTDGEIALDGTRLSAGSRGTPLPIDPGHHVLAVKAAGKAPWERGFDTTSDGATETLTIGPLEALPAPSAPSSPAAAAPTGERRSTAPAFVIGGVGIAAAIAGGLFYALALSAKSSSDDARRAGDAARSDDLYDTALTRDRIGVGLGIAGGVALAAGAVLLLTSRSPKEPGGGVALQTAPLPGGAWGFRAPF